MPVRRYRIRGRVQMVGFRDWTVAEARALGLDGWVRNRADGSVEAVAAGSEDQLAEFQRRCRGGPRHARVDAVEVADEADMPPAGFAREPDA